MRRARVLLSVFGVAVLSLLFSLWAYAGSLFITGHDADFHAYVGKNKPGARSILRVATSFALNGSTKPILLLQTRTTPLPHHTLSDQGLIAAGIGPCPTSSPCFVKLNVTQFKTAKFSEFGVIFIPSDFGGTLSQEELDAVNARSDELIDYLNAGGGLVALAESGDGQSDLTRDFFGFLPFVVSAPPVGRTETGNKVTAFGASLGLTNDDVNGNFSHNIFVNGQGMQVVDVDPKGNTISITFRGQLCPGGPCLAEGIPELSPFWILLLIVLFSLLMIREIRRRVRA